jgi:hypothetical protein
MTNYVTSHDQRRSIALSLSENLIHIVVVIGQVSIVSSLSPVRICVYDYRRASTIGVILTFRQLLNSHDPAT